MGDDNIDEKKQEVQKEDLKSDQAQIPQPNQPQEESPLVSKQISFNPKILTGILFIAISGLTLAYFLRFSKIPSTTVPAKTVEEPTSTPIFLSIESPKNEAIAVDGEILVSGRTLPSSTVVIFTGSDEVIVESNQNGLFEETVLLDENTTSLIVTAFSDDGQEKTINIDINKT